VASWAQRFLFSKEQLKNPVRSLSGGERARIHIARLMLEPADVLVLDEPTNDLDIPSLEVLEESLEDFPGAILLVTHDRAMLARLATEILALDGVGGARYFTDYDQWERFGREVEKAKRAAKSAAGSAGAGAGTSPSEAPSRAEGAAGAAAAAPVVAQTKKKLAYKEQQELAGMEKAIEKAEREAKELETAMLDPAVIADHAKYADVCRRVGEAQERVAALYARWEELEAKK
jgi:ATP-binding cassette subfamily F protein uup